MADKKGPVELATRRTLRRLKDKANPDVYDALAAGAIALARELDNGAGMSAAAIHRELRTTIEDLLPKTEAPDDNVVALMDRIRRASTATPTMGDQTGS